MTYYLFVLENPDIINYFSSTLLYFDLSSVFNKLNINNISASLRNFCPYFSLRIVICAISKSVIGYNLSFGKNKTGFSGMTISIKSN
jgi:hypothetical protein